MKPLREKLSSLVAEAFRTAGLDPSLGEVVVSARPDLGQFQCNGPLPAAKAAKANPRQIAQAVVDRLAHDDVFRYVSVAGPGFINLSLTDEFLATHAREMRSDQNLGCAPVASPQRIVLDYGGPNIAKPMHVGHLRAAIIGESLKRLARYLGHDVVGDVHLGDWGLQMGMVIAELARRRPDLPYFEATRSGPYPSASPVSASELEEIYPTASQRAKADPGFAEAARQATFELQQGRPGYRALWRHLVDVSVAELKADYDRLEVGFDLWLGESDAQPWIPPLIERLRAGGHARESEGALVVDVAEAGDAKELPPLLLLKSDGAALYGTTDLATLDHRVRDLGAQRVLYVVDKRQADHFTQVFRAARRTGIAPPAVGLEHIGFGTMNGSDGRPFKTREGGVMKLRDLLDLVTAKARERIREAGVARDYPPDEVERIAQLVGIATLKYADLSNHRAKDYIFDLERFSSFEGRTGPYLLYAAVRTRSILRKAAEAGLVPGTLAPAADDVERGVLLTLARYPDSLHAAFENRAPNILCDYAYELATAFTRFYQEHHILSQTDPARRASWLGLCDLTVRVLLQVLELLGIRVPERM
ncbi:MAG: arginine--tRNA ligase [Deferrisomatales bacterium]|nr:arginine--tRNA ligase [Deferrisomatales bacterium]